MSKRIKELTVQELRREFEGVETCLVVDVHQAKGPEAVALRRYLRERGIRLRTVKNSLAARALSELGLGEVRQFLEGPCALASGEEDLLALAKAVVDLRREHRTVQVRGGVCSGRPVGPEQLQELARLGSREALLAVLIGTFQAPLRQVATVVAAPLSGLAGVLSQAARKIA